MTSIRPVEVGLYPTSRLHEDGLLRRKRASLSSYTFMDVEEVSEYMDLRPSECLHCLIHDLDDVNVYIPSAKQRSILSFRRLDIVILHSSRDDPFGQNGLLHGRFRFHFPTHAWPQLSTSLAQYDRFLTDTGILQVLVKSEICAKNYGNPRRRPSSSMLLRIVQLYKIATKSRILASQCP